MTSLIQARGMALLSAVFMITLLLGIAAAIAAFSRTEHATVSQSLQAAKAYYGAKAGLEWGIQQAIAANNATLCPAGGTAGSVGPFALTESALAGVSVTVTCTRRTFTGSNFVFELASGATVGTLGNLDYAERHVSATVSNIP